MNTRPKLPDREVMYRTVLARSRLIQSGVDPDAIDDFAIAEYIRAAYAPCPSLHYRCARCPEVVRDWLRARFRQRAAPCEGTDARCAS